MRARPSAYTQVDAGVARVHAARTQVADVVATAATAVTPFGYTTAAQADAIPAGLNNARADITSTRAVLNQLIDDLQSVGLLQ